MIPIDRARGTAPARLLQAAPGELATIAVKAQASPPTLRSSDFKTAVYGSKAVKEALWDMQHGKCCFCELPLEISFATVEHFRPKTRALQVRHVPASGRLGYWWLAYEFGNLYLCCSNCNSPKSDWFPLQDGATALPESARPWDPGVTEACLILDPGSDPVDPHIDWVFVPGKGPVPVGRTPRGQATLEAVALDVRDHLTRHRALHYRSAVLPVIARHQQARAAGDAAGVTEALEDARLLAEPDMPWAGMSRAMLNRAGLL